MSVSLVGHRGCCWAVPSMRKISELVVPAPKVVLAAGVLQC